MLLDAARCNRLEFDAWQFCNCFPPKLLTFAISQFVSNPSKLIIHFYPIFFIHYLSTLFIHYAYIYFFLSKKKKYFILFYIFLFYPVLTIQDLHKLFLDRGVFSSPVFFLCSLGCWWEDEVI